ncbi:hypothetical protein B0H14DRAFT_2577486 [Mycena olivaceomarginata]|nr:hypothetical protein B0H14DRAFT_2577486 [Mycena olivaceomarginata]
MSFTGSIALGRHALRARSTTRSAPPHPHPGISVPRAALPHRAPPLAVPPARALVLAASAAPGVVRARACVAACAVRSWTGASSPQTARKLAQRRSMRPPRLGAAPRSNGPEHAVGLVNTHGDEAKKEGKERKEKKKERKERRGRAGDDLLETGRCGPEKLSTSKATSSAELKSVEEDEEELDESFEDGDVDEEEPT